MASKLNTAGISKLVSALSTGFASLHKESANVAAFAFNKALANMGIDAGGRGMDMEIYFLIKTK